MEEAPAAAADGEPQAKIRQRTKKLQEDNRKAQFQLYITTYLFVSNTAIARADYIRTGNVTCTWCLKVIAVAGNKWNIVQHAESELYVVL